MCVIPLFLSCALCTTSILKPAIAKDYVGLKVTVPITRDIWFKVRAGQVRVNNLTDQTDTKIRVWTEWDF